MNSTQRNVLRRYFGKMDPGYAEMELFVSKVCVLRYQEQWQDMEIEGTLYMYKSGPAGPHRIVLPDRRSPRKFTLDVTSSAAAERHGRLLILSDITNASHFGLWFRTEEEACRVHCLVKPGM